MLTAGQMNAGNVQIIRYRHDSVAGNRCCHAVETLFDGYVVQKRCKALGNCAQTRNIAVANGAAGGH